MRNAMLGRVLTVGCPASARVTCHGPSGWSPTPVHQGEVDVVQIKVVPAGVEGLLVVPYPGRRSTPQSRHELASPPDSSAESSHRSSAQRSTRYPCRMHSRSRAPQSTYAASKPGPSLTTMRRDG